MIRFLLTLFVAFICLPTSAQRYPPSGGGGCETFANQAALPLSAIDGTCAVTLDADTMWVYNLSGARWLVVGTGGSTVTSVGTFGSSPNANGASIASNVLTLQPADGTHPGGLTAGSQTIGGSKTFSSNITLSGTGNAVGTITSGIWNGTNIAIANGGTGLSTTSQNFSFIGPTSGSGAPSWRLLTAGDIPSLSYLPLSGGTMSGAISMGSNKITTMTDPTLAQDAATKNYVDTQLAQLNPAAAVFSASTANIAGTYVNAVSGVCVGDTFTITATGAMSLDGTSPAVGARVLLKNQTSSFQNGVWNVTVAGTTGVSPVLTRALDFDSSTGLNAGSIVPVINGTANAGSSWYQTATVSTCNTDSQTWIKFQNAASAYLLVANNLSDVASANTSFNNISPMTTLGDVVYEDATPKAVRLAGNTTSTAKFLSQTGTGSVSAAPSWVQPSCSSLSNAAASCSTDATNASNISSGTLGVAEGGTGRNSLTNHGVLVGATTSGITQLAAAAAGTLLTGQGSGADPSFSATPVLGVTGTTGTLGFTGLTSGVVTVQPQSAAGTYNFNLPITAGNSGQLLTSAGGASAPMTWSTATTVPTVTTQSSTLNPAVINTQYILSGASFTITLPTASGVAGQTVSFLHNGTSLTQVYTFNTTSSQTIGGVASGSYALYTNGEILVLASDGSNWQIQNHKAQTAWAAYTPTLTGFGVVTGLNAIWKRNQGTIDISAKWTNGTAAGAGTTALITLPGSMSTGDSTQIPSALTLGVVWGNSHNPAGLVLAQASTAGLNFSSTSSGVATAITNVSSQFVSTSELIVMQANSVPITGFQP